MHFLLPRLENGLCDQNEPYKYEICLQPPAQTHLKVLQSVFYIDNFRYDPQKSLHIPILICLLNAPPPLL